MHAKRPRYCSRELKFTEPCKHKEKNACKRWREQTWRRRRCSNVESVMVAWSVFVNLKPFPSVLYLRLFLAFSFPCIFVTLFIGSCTFFSHVLQILFAEKMEQKLKVSPCFFLVSPFFFVFSFLFFLFYCLPSWFHSNARMKEEAPSVLCVFSLLTAYLSCVFCLSFSVYLPPSLSRRGLYSLTCSSI